MATLMNIDPFKKKKSIASALTSGVQNLKSNIQNTANQALQNAQKVNTTTTPANPTPSPLMTSQKNSPAGRTGSTLKSIANPVQNKISNTLQNTKNTVTDLVNPITNNILDNSPKLRAMTQYKLTGKPQAVVGSIKQPTLNIDQNGWKKYYDEEFKKIQGRQNLAQRLFDGGNASRLAEQNARNKYNQSLIQSVYDDNGNLRNKGYENAAETLRGVTNAANNRALSNDEQVRAQGRTIGANYDSDLYTGVNNDNVLQRLGKYVEMQVNPIGYFSNEKNRKEALSALNASTSADVASGVLGAKDEVNGNIVDDAARFGINLLPGSMTAPLSGARNAGEAISGRGIDQATGNYKNLTGLERAGKAVSAAIDIGGIFTGGTGDMLQSLAAKASGTTNETVVKGVWGLLKAMAEEGGEEGLQQIADYFGEGGTLTDDKGNFDWNKLADLEAQVAQSAGLGALGGGIFHVGSKAIDAGVTGTRNAFSKAYDSAVIKLAESLYNQDGSAKTKNGFIKIDNPFYNENDKASGPKQLWVPESMTKRGLNQEIASAPQDVLNQVVEQTGSMTGKDLADFSRSATQEELNSILGDNLSKKGIEQLKRDVRDNAQLDLANEQHGEMANKTLRRDEYSEATGYRGKDIDPEINRNLNNNRGISKLSPEFAQTFGENADIDSAIDQITTARRELNNARENARFTGENVARTIDQSGDVAQQITNNALERSLIENDAIGERNRMQAQQKANGAAQATPEVKRAESALQKLVEKTEQKANTETNSQQNSDAVEGERMSQKAYEKARERARTQESESVKNSQKASNATNERNGNTEMTQQDRLREMSKIKATNFTEAEINNLIKDQKKIRRDMRHQERITERLDKLKRNAFHFLVDDAYAFAWDLDKSEKGDFKTGTASKLQNLNEGVDRVRSSGMLAKAFMDDNGYTTMLEKLAKERKIDQFEAYIKAKSVLEAESLGKKTSADRAKTIADSKGIVAALQDKFVNEEAQYRAYTQTMRDYMHDNGLISDDVYNYMNKNRQYYAPLNRIFGEDEKADVRRNGKSLGNMTQQTVVQKMEGSERAIANVLESTMNNTMTMINEVERNKLARGVTEINAYKENRLAKDQEPRKGYGTISYLENGKKVTYEVPQLVATEMKNINNVLPGWADATLSFLGQPAKMLRTGATGVNPTFAIANLIRDTGQTLITGRLDTNIRGIVPAFQATFLNTENAKSMRAELNRAGIIGSEYRQTYGIDGATIEQIKAENRLGGKAIEKLKHPMDAVADVIGLTENYTRAKQYFGTKGDATVKAQAARNNTLNFTRGGTLVRTLNRVIPFLNAGVQGGRMTVRSFKERPVRTSIAMATMFGVAMAVKGMNSADDKKEVWDRVSDADKQTNLIFLKPGAKYNNDTGRIDGLVKIPIPQMLYPIADAVNNLNGTPDDFLTIASDIFTATTGIESPDMTADNFGDAMRPMVNQLMPQVAKPMVEGAFNQNLFYGTELSKDRGEKNMAPEDKDAKRVSQLSREIAKRTGWEPAVIDNFIKSYGSDMALDAVKAIMDNPDNPTDDGNLAEKLWTNPLYRRFASTTAVSPYQIQEENATKYKEEVKNSDKFKELDKETQKKVLDNIDTDTKALASRDYKAERGYEDNNKLTKRQQNLSDNGFKADEYIESATKTTKSGSSGSTKTGTSTKISDKVDSKSKYYLNKREEYTKDEWNEALRKNKDLEYKYARAKYENDLAEGKITARQKITKEKDLKKKWASKDYDYEIRDAYGLASNTTDMQKYLDNLDGTKRAKAVDELNSLNRTLYNYGVISASTFKSRYKAINNTKYTYASGGGTKKKGSGGGLSASQAKKLASAMSFTTSNANKGAAGQNSVSTKRQMSGTRLKGGTASSSSKTSSKKITVKKGIA